MKSRLRELQARGVLSSPMVLLITTEIRVIWEDTGRPSYNLDKPQDGQPGLARPVSTHG